MIKIEKSIYDKPEASDGERVLVMRTWPRGISKGRIDVWIKDLGTPRELIREWKSGKISWGKFVEDYIESLNGKEDSLRRLAEESKRGTVTLLCTDKNPDRCHRSLLKAAIEELG